MSEFVYYFLNAKEQYCYKVLREALFKHEETIPLREISAEGINTVLKAVLTDTPELFWFEGKWRLEIADRTFRVVPEYTLDADEARELARRLDETGEDFRRKTAALSEYKKIRAAYERIITTVRYDETQKGGQTVRDALIDGKAVCKGLSKSLQYLLGKAGCFSTLREGTLDGVSGHVWNIVRIDNVYYNVDVSMGYECFSYLFAEKEADSIYRCFLVSDAELERTHRIYRSPLWSLNCGQTFSREV